MLRPFSRPALWIATLLAMTMGAASLPAQSRDDPHQLKVAVSADGTTLYLTGMFLDGAFHQVDAALRMAPGVRWAYLSSSGGFTIEGRLVAALVRKYRLNTYVEYYCASACTQVFAAGQQRVIGPQARLGFHQAAMVDDNGMMTGVRAGTERQLDSATVFGVNGNDTLRLAYELAGTDPAFIAKALSFDPENMWLPSAAELLESRLVTRLSEQSELPPPGGAVTRDAVHADLLERPLWRAAAARFPDLTEAAIGDVWRAANSGFSLPEAAQTGRAKLAAEASRLLATADDALLARALALYASAARSQRVRGYPGCDRDTIAAQADDPEDSEFARAEDALFTAVMLSPRKAEAMKVETAARYFIAEVTPRLVDTANPNDVSAQGALCRIGFDTFEAIDSLPGSKRVKAYRALLSLPGN